jgi:hypothetical protein
LAVLAAAASPFSVAAATPGLPLRPAFRQAAADHPWRPRQRCAGSAAHPCQPKHIDAPKRRRSPLVKLCSRKAHLMACTEPLQRCTREMRATTSQSTTWCSILVCIDTRTASHVIVAAAAAEARHCCAARRARPLRHARRHAFRAS